MDKDDVEPGAVYLARAQDPEYDDRMGIVRVTDVPDDDHPDVIGKTLFSNHEGSLSGNETSMSPSMFEEQLYDVQALAAGEEVPQPR